MIRVMNWLKKLWRAEPVIVGIVGNVAFWPTVFLGASSLGHPIDPKTQKLLMEASGLLTGAAIRQTVTAPDTLDQHLADIKAANAKGH